MQAQRALKRAGINPSAFDQPPIKPWQPQHPLPNLPDPLTRSAIRKLQYAGSDLGRSILQVHPNRNTPVRDDFIWPKGWVERAMHSYAWVFDQVSAWIQERDLGVIAVYNGRFTHDQAAAAAAKAQGIPVLYYDAGGIQTGFDLTPASTHDWAHLQERMLAMWENWPEPDRISISQAWFANRQNHSEPGIDVFIGDQEIGYLGSLPGGDQIVAFFSSSGDEIAELDLDWNEYCQSQEHALKELAAVCAQDPHVRLIVRTHPHMRLKPHDDQDRWNAVVASCDPDLHLDANSPVDSYALMHAVDTVFTYGSTAGVEASYLGKPVLVMGPSAYDQLGCATLVSQTELIPHFLENPPPPRPERAMLYGLMMMRRGFNYEFVTWDEGEPPLIGNTRLADAHPIARKVSDALNARRLNALLRR